MLFRNLEIRWNLWAGLIALIIVIASSIFSHYLSEQIAEEERSMVNTWVEAEQTILKSTDSFNINLASKITSENTRIPIIETNEKDEPTGNWVNLDSIHIDNNTEWLKNQINTWKNSNRSPIVVVLSDSPYIANKYYYGESQLARQIRWFPLIQLLVVGIFIAYLFLTQYYRYKNNQNQLWVGMAKETAHQLGTPLTSLQGWMEILKEKNIADDILQEIKKDVERLQLVSDRFGKIGSQPQLEKTSIVDLTQRMIDYMKKRTSQHTHFSIQAPNHQLFALTSPPLIEWVIENICKNALDSMEGKGAIEVTIGQQNENIYIDIKDTGKGMSPQTAAQVFRPGFTTKKRGWGIGLTLSKRIMEEYHPGKLQVLHTELHKGTTFRLILPIVHERS